MIWLILGLKTISRLALRVRVDTGSDRLGTAFMAVLRVISYIMVEAAFICLAVSSARSQESSGAEVLLSFDRQQAEAATGAAAELEPVVQATVAQLPVRPLEQSTAKIDPTVVAASHEAVASHPPEAPGRRQLAPRAQSDLFPQLPAEHERSKLPFNIPYVDSLGTAGAGLVLVVGLFLLCVSLMRRGGPSPTTPLPPDAVAVLGRVPLTPKQFAHLIQVGNKLVLVSIAGDRTDTITEITDPAEVERLLVLCLRGSKQGSSAEFQKLLAQMAKEPARGFLGREATTSFRTTRG